MLRPEVLKLLEAPLALRVLKKKTVVQGSAPRARRSRVESRNRCGSGRRIRRGPRHQDGVAADLTRSATGPAGVPPGADRYNGQDRGRHPSAEQGVRRSGAGRGRDRGVGSGRSVMTGSRPRRAAAACDAGACSAVPHPLGSGLQTPGKPLTVFSAGLGAIPRNPPTAFTAWLGGSLTGPDATLRDPRCWWCQMVIALPSKPAPPPVRLHTGDHHDCLDLATGVD